MTTDTSSVMLLTMKTPKKQFQNGDRVRSHYGSPWLGIILHAVIYSSADKKTGHWVYDILAVIDKNGNRMRKPLLKRLDGAWLSACNEQFTTPENMSDYLKLFS